MLQVGRGFSYHYSGPRSCDFWERLNSIRRKNFMKWLKLYGMGCILKNLEYKMIDKILMAEIKYGNHNT